MLTAGALSSQTATAQTLSYSQNFQTDDSAHWAVNYDTLGSSNRVIFQFDYSTIGIPSAPHSTGGTTIGMKMIADINPAGAVLGSTVNAGFSVSPTNYSITENFVMHADMWINTHSDKTNATLTTLTSANGGSGSSMFYGCGYGTAGTGPQIAGHADSVFVGTCSDSGSSARYRMYAPLKPASYQDGDYQISATPSFGYVYNSTAGSRNFSASVAPAPVWTTIFPSVQPPLAQVLLYRQQTNVQCVASHVDFAWHDVQVRKVATAISYWIDGNLIATANTADAGTPAGGYLLFTA